MKTAEEYLNKKAKEVDGYESFYAWLEFQPVDYVSEKIAEWVEEYASQKQPEVTEGDVIDTIIKVWKID